MLHLQCVAVDFDGTWTVCPSLMADFCERMFNAGIIVVCVTSRSATEKNVAEIRRCGVPEHVAIVCCGGRYKREVLRKCGYTAWFVIDDQPEAWGPGQPMWRVRLLGAWKWLESKMFSSIGVNDGNAKSLCDCRISGDV